MATSPPTRHSTRRSGARYAANACASARATWSPKNFRWPALWAAIELLQEQSAEQAREHAHRQEEAGPARHPALAVERDAAARHDHVDMRMMGERRTPGMENRGDADAGAEMAGVGGDRDQGLDRCLEQDIVDYRLVLVGDIC